MTTTPAPTDLDFDPACSCRRCGKCDRALGELAKLRDRLTEAEAVIIKGQDALTTDHPVFWVLDDYDGSMDSVQTLKRERDAAREELAKTRAELDAAQREWKAWEHLANKAAKERNALRAKYEPTPAGTADTEAANPATTAEPAAPHCGLCGSEDCPGRPGTGCSPGPYETYEPADEPKATGGIVTNLPVIGESGCIVPRTFPARQIGKTAASEAWIAEQEAAGHTVLRVGTTKAEPAAS